MVTNLETKFILFQNGGSTFLKNSYLNNNLLYDIFIFLNGNAVL